MDKKLKFTDAEKANFDAIISEINGFMQYHKQQETPPSISELDQFHKSWFYNNWLVRFRKLNAFSNLGTRGVIAIPNTTFEEWLWWFHEWAEALTDDYNKFKQMVYEALMLIQKHLEAIDQTLEDHEQRITNLEKEINEIKNLVQKLGDEINNLKNEIHNANEIVNKIVQNLINSGAWNPETNDFYPNRNIATGNINFFGGSADGSSFIRTNNGSTENDVTAGI